MLKATPAVIVPYVLGLLMVAGRATCTKMARRLSDGISHDQLTRALQAVQSEGQALLLRLTKQTVGELTDGYPIIDDTVIPKVFARCIDCIGWMYCSKERRQLQGLCVVALMWSNGTVTVPLAFKLWRPGKKKRTTLALELLAWAKKHRIKPRYVLFDCFYPAKKILKRCHSCRWHFISQVKRNRKLNNIQVCRFKRHPYWTAVGTIDGGLKVTIVRHGKKFFITDDAMLSGKEIRREYKNRWGIEDTFRLLHDQLGMDTYQARSATAQENHINFCCLAYLVITQQAKARNITPYQLKDDLIFERERWDIQFVEGLLVGA